MGKLMLRGIPLLPEVNTFYYKHKHIQGYTKFSVSVEREIVAA